MHLLVDCAHRLKTKRRESLQLAGGRAKSHLGLALDLGRAELPAEVRWPPVCVNLTKFGSFKRRRRAKFYVNPRINPEEGFHLVLPRILRNR